MLKTAVLLVAVCGAGFAAGCEATLDGTCDEATRAVAFRVACGPEPQYAGQSLVNHTCAGGFCHSSEAVNDATTPQLDQRDQRHGVPRGFDFDLAYATTAVELERLREHQARVFGERGRLFDTVVAGSMPPAPPPPLPGYPDFDPVNDVQGTFADTGEELPAVDTPEGRAILRAWLVCGAPVVERTIDMPAAPGMPVGDALDAVLCPVEPNFPSLFNKVIRLNCALGACHGGTPATGMMHLDPDSPDATYESLLGTGLGEVAMGSECGGLPADFRRVIPGEPSNSLLIQKLDGNLVTPDTAVCGDRMPQGGPYLPEYIIQAFRQWIAEGAMRAPPI